jgi:hypothetical protein
MRHVLQDTSLKPTLVSFREAIEAAKRSAGSRFSKVPDALTMPLQQRDFKDAMHKVDETVYSNITGRTGKANYWCLVSGGAPGIGIVSLCFS